MMKSPAFTLIELLVYTALFSFFTIIVAGFGHIVFTIIKQQSVMTARALHNAVALDLLRRDVMSASMEKSAWDSSAFVFKKESVDTQGALSVVCVGWECTLLKNVQAGVRRSEGVYDFVQRRWKSRTVSLLGCALSDLQLSLELSRDRQRVARAVVRYGDDSARGIRTTEVVKLRNRVLV